MDSDKLNEISSCYQKHELRQTYLAERIEDSIRLSSRWNGWHTVHLSKGGRSSCDDIGKPDDDLLNRSQF